MMGNIPRPRTGVRPVSGSVGRQRINAPIEAFGGGAAAQGLARLGQGVASTGTAVQQVGSRQDEQEQQQAKLAARKAADLQKISSDSMVLSYEQSMQNTSNSLRARQGVNAANSLKVYDDESKKARDSILKDIKDPALRATLETRMMRSDLSRRNSLASHEAKEISNARAQSNKALGDSIETKMGNSFDTLATTPANEWASQFSDDILEYGLRLREEGLPTEKVNELVNARIKRGATGAVRNMIAKIGAGANPVMDTEATVAKIEELRALRVVNEETAKKLHDDAVSVGETAVRVAEERRQKAINQVLTNFGDVLFNTTSQPERDQALQDFILQNPEMEKEARKVWKSNKVITNPTVVREWTDKLMFTRDPEKYQKDITDAYLKGEIGERFYNEQMKASDSEMDSRKKTIWRNLTQRMTAMMKGRPLPGDKKKLPGDERIDKEFMEDWGNLRLMAMDPNVTFRELQEATDKALFKPEAEMASRSAEERLSWTVDALQQAAALPGTQSIDRAGVDAPSRMSDEDLMGELRKRMRAALEIREFDETLETLGEPVEFEDD